MENFLFEWEFLVNEIMKGQEKYRIKRGTFSLKRAQKNTGIQEGGKEEERERGGKKE